MENNTILHCKNNIVLLAWLQTTWRDSG